jgi:hypothetical protein
VVKVWVVGDYASQFSGIYLRNVTGLRIFRVLDIKLIKLLTACNQLFLIFWVDGINGLEPL